MTEKGTFIISGAERVVVNQLLRSPGIYFSLQQDAASGRELCTAKLIPEHGAWLEFETSNRDVIFVKVNGKRKIPVAILLRAIGYDNDSELLELFRDVETSSEHTFIQSTMEREPSVSTREEALIDIYKRLRPGEPPTHENAQTLLNNLFFNPRRYDLGRVGRYKLNNRLGLDIDERCRCLAKEDFIEIVRRIIKVNNGKQEPDDIDHLRNRRVRTAGHLIQNQFRIGLLRLERTIKERMSVVGPEAATPAILINNRPIVAAVREFFGGSQLSQFMDQTNPLAELTHKRRLSAMGPGGLSRERAGFDVRDVHHSHYGKICPIETPEGPNIGLIGSLATYASINDYGFIQTPYRKVIHEVPNTVENLINRSVLEGITDSKGDIIVSKSALITKEIAKKIASLSSQTMRVVPFVSEQIVYLTADEEERYAIAQANALLNQRNEFIEDRIGVIRGGKYLKEPADKIDFMDVSPKQVFSVTTSLIPFLEHDDANRALMGSNMQRQAVPLLRPEAPLIATGMEKEVAKYSGQVVFAREDGEVVSVDSTQVTIAKENGDEHVYPLMKFVRTNQGTCVNQRPVVSKGDKVKKEQVIADGSATDCGELALGQNILCAFMSWRGYNFEDAIIISDRLVKNDRFTSIHIEKHEIEARETKLGTEEITRDIPNVGEESLRDLDESGIIRIGAEVGPGSILVGKISPKGETELTAEERLLRAIFGEKAREVKDSSLRVPHGERGKVIDVRVFSRDNHSDLPAGVYCLIRVWVAQKRKISVGDKMAGRHGNKGVISCILPEGDLPFLPDGRPVDIILNPIGVPSRMNIGQILETHLGWAAETLGLKVLNPIFDGANDIDIEDALARAWIVQQAGIINRASRGDSNTVELNQAKTWLADNGYNAEKVFDDRYPREARKVCLRLWLETLGVKVYGLSDEEVEGIVEKVYLEQRQSPPIFGKVTLRDGRTGEPFDQPVTVGSIYMMKLNHLVEDKVHARSTGPYSLITQQPLGGKAQFGGQRFGEMEVWALEAYGASHMLQELLTVKSDDVAGRAKAYESLVKGEDIFQLGVPESFKVLFMELRSLCLTVELLNEEEEMVSFLEERKKIGTKLGGLS
jgi:DNA-directed RNA polymerase subunit beta